MCDTCCVLRRCLATNRPLTYLLRGVHHHPALMLPIILPLFFPCHLGLAGSVAAEAAVLLSVCPDGATSSNNTGGGGGGVHHQTLFQAQQRVRGLLAGGHKADIIVELCSSAPHGATRTLVLGPEDSPASSEQYVEYRGRGGLATLDSGLPIRGWRVAPPIVGAVGSTTVWEAALPAGAASRQLWVNGRRAARAHGNPRNCSGGAKEPGDLSDGGPSGECSRTLVGGNLSSTGYHGVPDPQAHLSTEPLAKWLPGAEFLFGKGGSGASWTEPRCTVDSVTAGAEPGTADIVMSQPCWSRATLKGGAVGVGQGVNRPSDIENALPLLVTPGQWFGDFHEGKIYYSPRPGESPTTLQAVLGTVPEGHANDGAAITLLPGSRNLRFRNLAFTHQTWLEPTVKGFVDLQSGYYFSQSAANGKGISLRGVPGALALHGAQHILVSNCSFIHLGLTGVLVDEHSQNITIIDSTFRDTSGSAIALGNVSHPIQTAAEQDGQYLVARNHIRNTGAEYSGCAGIVAGYVAQASITQNDIADVSNGAVCLGWGWGANNSMHSNKVTHNRIEHSNTYLYDCGSIYTLSAQPNSEVAYNFIIDQVLLFGSLYHDARSAYFHTHHNVVVGGPMWLCKHTTSPATLTCLIPAMPAAACRHIVGPRMTVLVGVWRLSQTCSGVRSGRCVIRS
eukprot:COSAG01_NODE_795_length_13541_cov_5.530725_5_plen_677_part_00